jgi:hypothetical protein
MKIHLERSGGYAGMIMSTTVDTNTLSSNEANELQDLIEKSQFFNLSSQSLEEASSKTKKGAADYFIYKITIQHLSVMISVCHRTLGQLLIFW